MSSPYEDLRWQELAACLGTRDPDMFFPERGGSSRQAREVCDGREGTDSRPGRLPCPVRGACLRYALANREQFGVWGGTSERERRQLVKEDRGEPEQARRAS